MNLLVLCTDTFRADYFGCYDNNWIDTPHLGKLASQGVRFTDFCAEELPTLPVRRVFYTGRRVFPFAYHPQKGHHVQLPGWRPLSDENVTLAEWLSERGYTTGLITDVYHQMRPWMLWVEGFAPHEPWDAPPEFADRYYLNYHGLEPIWPSPFAKDYAQRASKKGTWEAGSRAIPGESER